MILEILQESDIDRVEDVDLKSYLEYSLNRLPMDFEYFSNTAENGYFVVVTELEDLINTSITIGMHTLYSIETELFWESVELIEKSDSGVYEILVHVDTDITISFILLESILSEEIKEKIQEFIYE